MVHVEFTPHLERFFPGLAPQELAASTVAQAIVELDSRFPRMRSYLVDDSGALRPHVNIFVGSRPLRDRRTLSDELEPHTKLYVMQALSGG